MALINHVEWIKMLDASYKDEFPLSESCVASSVTELINETNAMTNVIKNEILLLVNS